MAARGAFPLDVLGYLPRPASSPEDCPTTLHGSGIFAFGAHGAVGIVDTRSMSLSRMLVRQPPTAKTTALAWRPDALDNGSPVLAVGDERGAVTVWDVAGGRRLAWLAPGVPSAHPRLVGVSWATAVPDVLASLTAAGSLLLWDVRAGRELSRLELATSSDHVAGDLAGEAGAAGGAGGHTARPGGGGSQRAVAPRATQRGFLGLAVDPHDRCRAAAWTSRGAIVVVQWTEADTRGANGEASVGLASAEAWEGSWGAGEGGGSRRAAAAAATDPRKRAQEEAAAAAAAAAAAPAVRAAAAAAAARRGAGAAAAAATAPGSPGSPATGSSAGLQPRLKRYQVSLPAGSTLVVRFSRHRDILHVLLDRELLSFDLEFGCPAAGAQAPRGHAPAVAVLPACSLRAELRGIRPPPDPDEGEGEDGGGEAGGGIPDAAPLPPPSREDEDALATVHEDGSLVFWTRGGRAPDSSPAVSEAAVAAALDPGPSLRHAPRSSRPLLPRAEAATGSDRGREAALLGLALGPVRAKPERPPSAAPLRGASTGGPRHGAGDGAEAASPDRALSWSDDDGSEDEDGCDDPVDGMDAFGVTSDGAIWHWRLGAPEDLGKGRRLGGGGGGEASGGGEAPGGGGEGGRPAPRGPASAGAPATLPAPTARAMLRSLPSGVSSVACAPLPLRLGRGGGVCAAAAACLVDGRVAILALRPGDEDGGEAALAPRVCALLTPHGAAGKALGARWLGTRPVLATHSSTRSSDGTGWANDVRLTDVRSRSSVPLRAPGGAGGGAADPGPVLGVRTSPSGRSVLVIFSGKPSEVWEIGCDGPTLVRHVDLPFATVDWLGEAPQSAAGAAPARDAGGSPGAAARAEARRPSLAFGTRGEGTSQDEVWGHGGGGPAVAAPALAAAGRPPARPATEIGLDPDSELAASGPGGGPAASLAPGEATLPGAAEAAALAPAPVPERLAFALADGRVGMLSVRGRRVADGRPGRPAYPPLDAGEFRATCSAALADAVVLGSDVGGLVVWDVVTGACAVAETGLGSLAAVAIAPKGDPGGGQGWEGGDAPPAGPPQPPLSPAALLAVHGARVAVLSSRGAVGLWDLSPGGRALTPSAARAAAVHAAAGEVLTLDWAALPGGLGAASALAIATAAGSLALLDVSRGGGGPAASRAVARRYADALRGTAPVGAPPRAPALLPRELADALRASLLAGELPPRWLGAPALLAWRALVGVEGQAPGGVAPPPGTEGDGRDKGLSAKACGRLRRASFVAWLYGAPEEAAFWAAAARGLDGGAAARSGGPLPSGFSPASRELRRLRQRVAWHDALPREVTEASLELSELRSLEYSASGDLQGVVGAMLASTPARTARHYRDMLVAVAVAAACDLRQPLGVSAPASSRSERGSASGQGEAAPPPGGLARSAAAGSPASPATVQAAASPSPPLPSRSLFVQAAKVVTANAASVGDKLLGVPLLCAAGLEADAAAALADAGLWRLSAALAARTLLDAERDVSLARWASHIRVREGRPWRAARVLLDTSRPRDAAAALAADGRSEAASLFAAALDAARLEGKTWGAGAR